MNFFKTTYITRNHLIITTFNKLFHIGLYLVDRITHAEHFREFMTIFVAESFGSILQSHFIM
jgi:hypothetical protein